ncbi:son of sevenless homolog 2-like isoform X2 [Oratosquilla oratoria]|uniref:son of sevenless homolog 2-like isoform X2 n=1 Tax=Oratosquilla oratoria TaxID=337810 RepID=UPI003F759B69
MFTTSPSSVDTQVYNFESEENALKWKGLFQGPLRRVLEQAHPTLSAKDDALEYVESLILRLLATLCSRPIPHTVQDVENRVHRNFPNPIDRWAIGDAQAAIEKGRKKSSLFLPVERVHPLLCRDVLQSKIDYQVTLYIVAVLEYISADILRLAGTYVKNIKKIEVTQQDIRVAMCADNVLMDMFQQEGPPVEEAPPLPSLTYDELVKDLINEEKAYIRELHMITKVFRDKLQQIPSLQSNGGAVLDTIFSNIVEIYDFSVNLLGSLEDTLEVTQENESPAIGSCFEELAEGAEFDVYGKYAQEVLRPECREQLVTVVARADVSHALTTAGHGFKEAVKYYLPKLLLFPVTHIFTYFKYIELLLGLSENEEDQESMKQFKGLLWPLKSQLERYICNSQYASQLKRKLGDASLRHRRFSRQAALQKMNEVQRSIDGWEGKDIGQSCNELVLEGDLLKIQVARGKRESERHVFLFDALVVLCKSNNKRSSGTGQNGEYKFKEKYLMRMVEILDREDAEDAKHAFEIKPRDQPSVVLLAKTPEEKNTWMAALVMLNTRSMLDRTLDSILLDEEKKHPLRLPDPSVYQFAIQDSPENIIIEERENSGTPLIKGAILPKLVERLTYHMYADPMFVRTFLTTYRSFCTPKDLLHLLIQRFDIPEPEPPVIGDEEPQELKNQRLSTYREDLKRFRKEYSQPVQFRVLNVLRHWVDYHFYDFERDRHLLDRLTCFLEKVKGKSMRKWVESITKIVQRRCNEEQREITFSLNRSPPSPKWHMHLTDKDWELIMPISAGGVSETPDLVLPLLMLHPIEIARQLTLLEFELYRAVKPSELVGTPWIKEDKEKRSPYLLKMIHHTNNVTNWFMKCIVDCENAEERVAVMIRIIEIMVMFHDLNNFNGLLEVSSALDSAAVHRLELTKNEVRKRLQPGHLKIYDEASELSKNHCRKYQEKLRSINPPCVPFFGMYLTNILHIEEGNADFLQNAAEGLINFSKRRKVAEITGEIQQYQNQPYCLETEPKIRNFLETLQPFEGLSEHEICNYLYNKSKEIEPKNCKKALLKERRWPHLSLKSPGIKPRSNRIVPNPINVFTPKLNEEGEDTTPMLTPPTPSTPRTPPLTGPRTPPHTAPAASNHSIFANVEIGQNAVAVGLPSREGNSMSSTVMGTVPPAVPVVAAASSVQSMNPVMMLAPPAPLLIMSAPPPVPHPHAQGPPPLPPRGRKREPSVGDTSPKVKQAPDAPELPPRDVSPPPIPPRNATLPRMHSSGGVLFHQGSLHLHHRPSPPMPPPPARPQHQLDPPPPHRRNSSLDMSPAPLTRRHTTNGPHSAVCAQAPGLIMTNSTEGGSGEFSDSPPTPPPRQAFRHTFPFYDQHHS